MAEEHQSKLLEQVTKGAALKPTETKDSSAPVIDQDAHIGKNPFPAAMSELAAEGQNKLKKVDSDQVHDKSAPAIEAGTKIQENPMKDVLKEVPSGGALLAHKKVTKEVEAGAQLKKVDGQRDASAPIIEGDVHIKKNPLPDILKSLPTPSDPETGATGAALRHVEVAHDASKPVIDPSTHVHENPMKEVLKEVVAGPAIIAHKKVTKELEEGAHLKHVEVQHDASAPVIEADVHLKKNPFPDVLKGLPATSDPETGATGATLRHVEVAHDASKPVIDPNVHLHENPMKEVLKEVAAGQVIIAHKKLTKELEEGAHLKHVEVQHDASAPVIEADVHLKKNPLPDILKGLPTTSDPETGATGAALRHVEVAHDASKPVIDPNVHVQPAPQKADFADVKARAKDDQ